MQDAAETFPLGARLNEDQRGISTEQCNPIRTSFDIEHINLTRQMGYTAVKSLHSFFHSSRYRLAGTDKG